MYALVPRDEVRQCMLALVSPMGNIEGVSARKRRRGFPRKLNRTVVVCFARVAAHGLRHLSYSVAIVLKDPTASGGAILKCPPNSRVRSASRRLEVFSGLKRDFFCPCYCW